VLASMIATLTAEERARAGRYVDPGHARRFSAAHAWLRRVLGAVLGVAPQDVRLAGGAGKPRLAEGGAPSFNLSRSNDLALIAVADHPVGVDVEHISGGRAGLDAVDVACSPREAAALGRLPRSARADAFLCWWTAKEA